MIIEHRMLDKHQNADSLSKKTEFYERLEQKQANQAEIKELFSFLDKEIYEALPLTRWLNKSGHPIPGQPELPVEKAAEIKNPIQKGPGALGSVAALKPGPAGTVSHEHKQPLTAGQNGAGNNASDADAGWIVRERSDQRRPRVSSSHGITDSQ